MLTDENLLAINSLAGEISEENVPEEQKLKTLAKLATKLQKVQNKIADYDNEVKELKKEEVDISRNQIPQTMMDIGVSLFELTDGTRIEYDQKYAGHISKEHMGEAMKVLAERELGSVLTREIAVSLPLDAHCKNKILDKIKKVIEKEIGDSKITVTDNTSIHHQRLKSVIKEQDELGNPLPEDIFGIFKFFETKIK